MPTMAVRNCGSAKSVELEVFHSHSIKLTYKASYTKAHQKKGRGHDKLSIIRNAKRIVEILATSFFSFKMFHFPSKKPR